MTNVKLKAALPKDEESNGLGEQAVREFLANPRMPRVGIVVLQAKGEHTEYGSGTRQPEVGISRIELIEDTEEASNLILRAQALSEERTGNTPLPTIGRAEEPALDFEDGGDAA